LAVRATFRRAGSFARVAGAALIFVLILALSAAGGSSQSARTIRLIVPFPAGGSADLAARMLADEIGRAEPVSIVIENRPGASAVVGTEAASRAAPDGNTLLLSAPSLVINAHLHKVNYDPRLSFAPICRLVSSPQIILVNARSPYRTLADLLSAARAKPGALSLASVGPGSNSHIAFEILKRAAKVDITYVPYPGNAPAITALLGEHLTSAFIDYGSAFEQITGGQLRALAAGSASRIDALPDVPTLIELGLVHDSNDVWFGVMAPAKTPPDALARLAGWFTAALQAPELQPKLLAQGLFPSAICGADFGAFIQRQYEEFGRVIAEAKIKAE
jgi:tripartite-type tricarboxylate transporter receptor subunit TctC